jgi:hypothetical protein
MTAQAPANVTLIVLRLLRGRRRTTTITLACVAEPIAVFVDEPPAHEPAPLPASPLPAGPAAGPAVRLEGEELHVSIDDRRWRIRGLALRARL